MKDQIVLHGATRRDYESAKKYFTTIRKPLICIEGTASFLQRLKKETFELALWSRLNSGESFIRREGRRDWWTQRFCYDGDEKEWFPLPLKGWQLEAVTNAMSRKTKKLIVYEQLYRQFNG